MPGSISTPATTRDRVLATSGLADDQAPISHFNMCFLASLPIHLFLASLPLASLPNCSRSISPRNWLWDGDLPASDILGSVLERVWRKQAWAEVEVHLQCYCNRGLSQSHRELWSWSGLHKCPMLRQEDLIFIHHVVQSLDMGSPWRGNTALSKAAPFRWGPCLQRNKVKCHQQQHFLQLEKWKPLSPRRV